MIVFCTNAQSVYKMNNERREKKMKMKKILILTLALLMLCTTALAETKEFKIFVSVYETLDSNNIRFPTTGAAAVKKNDGDQYFYLTPTSNNLPSNRVVYFRSMYSKSTKESEIASKYVTVTKTTYEPKAKYLSGKAVGGHTYYLAGAGKAIQDDPYLGNYDFTIRGRWTP